MDLVQISKFLKTVCAIVISLKIGSACPYLFSKNMRSSSAFGDKNGHAYQMFTLITIAVFENFEIETKIIHPQSLLHFQQIFQSTNRIMDQKLTSKFFVNFLPLLQFSSFGPDTLKTEFSEKLFFMFFSN